MDGTTLKLMNLLTALQLISDKRTSPENKKILLEHMTYDSNNGTGNQCYLDVNEWYIIDDSRIS